MGQEYLNHSEGSYNSKAINRLNILRILIFILTLATLIMFTECRRRNTNNTDIPHEIASTQDESCLECHKTGEKNAPVVSHPDSKNCIKCHECQKSSKGKTQLTSSGLKEVAQR